MEVTDTSIGFDTETAERIFDAFTQANELITQQFGGLGPGLAISKATIDAHGGTIPCFAHAIPPRVRLNHSVEVGVQRSAYGNSRSVTPVENRVFA